MFEDIKLYKPTSKQLAIISLLFWILSLLNIALVSYNGSTLIGYEIVLLGFFAGNLAWLVNPLLLYILITLIAGTKSKKTIHIVIVVLLALNTYYPIPQGESSSALFGYGVGFILWVLSINFALIAVGVQSQELETKDRKTIGKIIKYLGVFLLVSILIGITIYNLLKHEDATEIEKKRLSTVILKKGSICTNKIQIYSVPLVGALEVIKDNPRGFLERNNPAHIFHNPEKLLYWGVPLVQMDSMNYSLLIRPNETQLIASVADKGASFKLKISTPDKKTISTILSDENKGLILFDQIWVNKYKEHYQEQIFCPDLKVNPKVDENPRKIILEALSIKNNSAIEEKKANYKNTKAKTYSEKIVNIDETKITREYLYENTFYGNCPDDIYIPLGKEGLIDGKRLYRSIKIDDTYYFHKLIGMDSFDGYACSENYLYLYTHGRWGKGRNNTFDIQKRSIKNFKLITYSRVHYKKGENLSKEVKILTAYEDKDNMFIELLDKYNIENKKLITISIEK